MVSKDSGIELTQPDRPWANIPTTRAENQSSITQINSSPVQTPSIVPQFDESPTLGLDAKIDDLRIAAEFIEGLRTATLEKSNMQKEDTRRLREAPSELPDELTDRHFLKALSSQPPTLHKKPTMVFELHHRLVTQMTHTSPLIKLSARSK